MKKLLLGFTVLLFTIILFHSCNEPLVNEPTGDELELKSADLSKKSYIVVLNDEELNAELVKLKGYEKKQEKMKSVSAKILKRAGVLGGEIGFSFGTAIQGFSVKIPLGQLKKLENDPSVKYIEENKVISLIQPESVVVVGDISAQAQAVPWGIARVNGGVDGSGKTAWVIDTGTDIDHPDLNVYMDDNGNSGYDFVNDDEIADDDNGHGTHVAGTIAALDNGLGVIGVAAGASIVPVKVLDASGSGWTDWVIAGVNYVAANASSNDVANMSLGGGISTALDDAVLGASSSCKFALAAGNERNSADLHSPARVNGPNIYTIAAFGEGDVWASYSNFGIPPVDYCEPGSAILSTYIDGQYATGSGTSMATPHMAGILLTGDFYTDGYIIRKRNDDPYPVAALGSGGGTANIHPSADFSFTITDFTVQFTDESSDSDGNIVSWEWNFGDGSTSTDENPIHTYTTEGTKYVTLTVSDGEDIDNITKPVTVTSTSTGGIELDASLRKVRGVRYVDLSWSGVTGSEIIIKVNGEPYTDSYDNSNDGTETLNMARSSGTFTFQICETDGSVSSNIVSLIL